MTSSSGQTVDYGMKIWAEGTGGSGGRPEIDIVAVQGLGADPYWTWVSKGNTQQAIWLRDFLPLGIPNARIASWGYNSKYMRDSPVTGLDVCGSDLLVALSHHRKGDMEKHLPLILIGHSFGGLVIKQALVLAQNRSKDPDFQRILDSTVGIIFLGTPHRGAHSAQLAAIIVQAAILLGASWKKELLKTLTYESEDVLSLDEQFIWATSSKELVCFYETKETPRMGLVVTRASASIHRTDTRNISLDCNHSQMNKFASRGDPNLVKIVEEVQRIIHCALYKQDPTPDEENVLKKIDPKDLDGSSPHAPCMPGTRQDILDQISTWVADLDAPNILWLKGYPGVGKSAIASTLVSQLRSSKRLGSSFFFQRARSSVMTTHNLWQKVAVDLARQYPSIRRTLVAMLQTNDDDFTTQSIEDVFCMLIQGPSRHNGDHRSKVSPVIVIDALDECGGLDGMNSEHRQKLMQTLKLWSSMPKDFKLIVTSRSETDLEDTFSEMAHHLIEIMAGQMATSSSSKDIHHFLQFHLCSIAINPRHRGTLAPDWPGMLVIDELTEKAGGLFIWAKTVIEFIKGGIPQKRLNQILEQRGVSSLADLYSQILTISFPNPDEEITQNFQSLVGTIILARRPLSASSIGQLLSIDEEVLKYICTGLQSVLDWGEVIGFNHQSFVDFILDENRCPPKFLVSQESQGQQLALACLHMMKKGLQFNTCQLQSSHLRNKDMVDLDYRLKIYVPAHLSYSCCFWMDHLTNIQCDQEIYEGLEYFINMQFLYWLEVLSIMKQVDLAHKLLTMLAKWMRDNNKDDVATRDMRDFVGTFATCISESTPHIYLSALPFSPANCWVSRQYLGQYSRRLILESGGHKEWPVMRNVLVGHKGAVNCVAFSPDGHHIVSGSDDTTIRVWNADTGQMTAGPFQGHTQTVTSVSFSPDGHHIVSGSHDTTIRVWNADTGQMTAGPFQGHTGYVTSVSFSPDGHHIMSGSIDRTIQVWGFEANFNQSSIFTPTSQMTQNGWVLGPNMELLFWVPPELRLGLLWPNNTLVIGKCIRTKINLSSFVHGEFWTQCKGL